MLGLHCFTRVLGSQGCCVVVCVASHCSGFSCCGARALGAWASVVAAWAWLLHRMWNLSGPGVEPMSPALAGGFSTTGPPGKSYHPHLMDKKVKAQRDWEVCPSSPSWLECARILTRSGLEPVLHSSALIPQETSILGNCFVLSRKLKRIEIYWPCILFWKLLEGGKPR